MVALCVYWPTIFIISHIPKDHVPKNVPVSGRAVHLVAYFVLTLLVFLNAGLFRSFSLRSMKIYLLVGAIAVYAAVDEWLQIYVQGRHGSPVDWSINVAACICCVVLLALLARRRSVRGDQLSK